MPLKDKQFFIFDMDGTLTQAVHDFEKMRQALELPEGMTILESIERRPKSEQDTLHKKLFELELDYAREAQQQAGAQQLLEAITKAGYACAILTRNSAELARITLEACGLLDFFDEDYIIGREGFPPKPHPAGILHLLQQWKASPSRAVMVGDYIYDLQAGRAAGVTTVHLDVNGNFPWPEQTDIACAHLDEVRAAAGL